MVSSGQDSLADVVIVKSDNCRDATDPMEYTFQKRLNDTLGFAKETTCRKKDTLEKIFYTRVLMERLGQ